MRDVRPPNCDSSANFPGVNSARAGDDILSGVVMTGEMGFWTFAGRVFNVRSGGAGSLYHLKSGFAERKASLYCKNKGEILNRFVT